MTDLIAVGTVSYPAAEFAVHLSAGQRYLLTEEVATFCQQVTLSSDWKVSGLVEPRSSSNGLIRKGDMRIFSVWEGTDEQHPNQAALLLEFKHLQNDLEVHFRSKFGRSPRTYPNLVKLPVLREKTQGSGIELDFG